MSTSQSLASSSALDDLPSLLTLEGWVHLPQAVAKCSIADVYSLCAIGERAEQVCSRRDVFLLDRFPCRSVEIVAWVAGVDRKEGHLNLTLDDGDGENVIIASVRLPEIKPLPLKTKSKSKYSKQTNDNQSTTTTTTTPSCFLSAKERRAARLNQSSTSSSLYKFQPHPLLPRMKQYAKKDIEVGDVVRVVGRVDDWCRRKEGRADEWVRQLAVEEGSGGSVVVVDQDEEYHHAAIVQHLHQTLYSRPFSISLDQGNTPASIRHDAIPNSPVNNSRRIESSHAKSIGYGDSMSLEPSSDSIMEDFEPELRDPSKLSSSQLTDRTFRLYVLDYMTRETTKAMRHILQGNPESDHGRSLLSFSSSLSSLSSSFSSFATLIKPIPQLQALFPEYYAQTVNLESTPTNPQPASQTGKSGQPAPFVRASSTAFSPSTKENSSVVDLSTPTLSSRLFRSKAEREADRYGMNQRQNYITTSTEPTGRPNDSSPLVPFTTRSLLSAPTLSKLAERVVNAQAKREEKARRQRMKDGTARPGDKQVEIDRVARGLSRGDWQLTDEERGRKALRLVEWTLRRINEDSALVQVDIPSCMQNSIRLPLLERNTKSLSSSSSSSRTKRCRSEGSNHEPGFLPLPPNLLLPLLIPLFRAEKQHRSRVFLSKTDPRRGCGMTVDLVMKQMKAWGEDGRWERVAEWVVLDAIEWGQSIGVLERFGKDGWWVVEDYQPK